MFVDVQQIECSISSDVMLLKIGRYGKVVMFGQCSSRVDFDFPVGEKREMSKDSRRSFLCLRKMKRFTHVEYNKYLMTPNTIFRRAIVRVEGQSIENKKSQSATTQRP